MKRFSKLIKWILFSILLCLVAGVVYLNFTVFPIVSGYGAKNLCSCFFVGERSAEDVIKKELGSFPLNIGSYKVDTENMTASGTVFGLAKRVAVFRKDLGCTLLVDLSEEELRMQKIAINRNVPPRTDTIPWPAGDLPDTSRLANVDYDRVGQLVDEAFIESTGKPLKNTRAMVIVYRGKIIAEKYAQGFDATSLHNGWSMTKSLFNNAMVGVMTKKFDFDIHKTSAVPAWTTDERTKISINDLLQMSSGLEWDESYGGESDATNMLYKEASMGKFAASKKLSLEPGTSFNYSSGTANILSMIVRDALAEKDYHNFPYHELYDKLGMYSLILEADEGETYVSSSYSFATARDWARFGLFCANNGKVNGDQIFPEDWIKYSTTPAAAAEWGQYGAQFWLNAGPAGKSEERFYTDVPADMFWADGYQGQRMFVIPSRDLVVVHLGLSTGEWIDDNKLISGILASIQ